MLSSFKGTPEEAEKSLKITDGKADRELLISLGDGRAINKDEYEKLLPYVNIGVVHVGASFKKRESQARLTESGKALLGIK